MSCETICPDCCDKLDLPYSANVVNEVCRKHCYACGSNEHWRMTTVDTTKANEVIDKWNAKHS